MDRLLCSRRSTAPGRQGARIAFLRGVQTARLPFVPPAESRSPPSKLAKDLRFAAAFRAFWQPTRHLVLPSIEAVARPQAARTRPTATMKNPRSERIASSVGVDAGSVARSPQPNPMESTAHNVAQLRLAGPPGQAISSRCGSARRRLHGVRVRGSAGRRGLDPSGHRDRAPRCGRRAPRMPARAG